MVTLPPLQGKVRKFRYSILPTFKYRKFFENAEPCFPLTTGHEEYKSQSVISHKIIFFRIVWSHEMYLTVWESQRLFLVFPH